MEWTIVNYDSLMDNIKRIHFIGIGGSGMCPLAEILHHEGYELSGSDMNEGETLDRIKGYGIPVFMGHAAENIKGAELVVYSAAIKETNPERQAAKELGIPCIERSVMLGIVTRRYRRSIAVSGTHGKTTTTAMLSQVLIGSGFDPSAIIGGKLVSMLTHSYSSIRLFRLFLILTQIISITSKILTTLRSHSTNLLIRQQACLLSTVTIKTLLMP